MHARLLPALIVSALTAGCTYDFDQFRDQAGSVNPGADAAGTADDSGGAGGADLGPEDTGSTVADTGPGDTGPTPDAATDAGADTGADTGATDAGLMDGGMSTEDAGADADEADMGIVPDPALCGNDVIDPGELCDPCPACDDMNACTTDSSQGSADTCDLVCSFSQPETQCISGDGCCPVACTLANDSDCTPDCTLDHTWPQNLKNLELQLFTAINQGRSQGRACGRQLYPPQPPFTLDQDLVLAARCQAEDMAKRNYVSATTPEGDQVDFWVNPTGYNWNQLASHVSSAATPQQMVDGWFASVRICERMMSPTYTEAGVGWATDPGTTGMLPRGAHIAAQPR
jgi:uncharacterized protein YkwD